MQVKKRGVDFARSKFRRGGQGGVGNGEAGLLLFAALRWAESREACAPGRGRGAAGARGPSLLAASEAPEGFVGAHCGPEPGSALRRERDSELPHGDRMWGAGGTNPQDH